MSTAGTPRILISRLSAIGDAVLTLPVACALRDHYPGAYIGWVIEKSVAPVVRGHHAIDAVIELEPGWCSSVRAIKQTKERLRAHAFETSLDCQGENKSAFAAQLSGARQRIGFARPYGCKFSRLTNNAHVTAVFPHLADRSLELLTPLGIHTPRLKWDFPLTNQAKLWALRWRHAIKSPRVAVLNPGATWPSKLWEIDRFGQTAKYLREQHGHATVVVWGNVYERIMAEKVADASGGAAVLAPQTDLQHLAALIESTDLFISGDSGPLHIAVAVGTPAIGLYGATLATMTGPYGQIVLQEAYEKGSLRHRRAADNSAMRAITVDHLCEAIDEVQRRRRLIDAA